MYTSWEVAAAIVSRIGGKEIHLKLEELDAVKGMVLMAEYHPGKIVYRLGTPEAWPEEPVTYALEDDDFERFQNQLGEPLPKQAGQKLADLLEEKPPWSSDIEVNGS